MENPVLEIEQNERQQISPNEAWMEALEAGKVLYFPHLPFTLTMTEQSLLRPDIRSPKARNISFGPDQRLKGAAGDSSQQAALATMLLRFRQQAQQLIASLVPYYLPALRLGNGSFRPAAIEGRQQSLRADDRLLHVDAFPSRPNQGERILRVFSNVNPANLPRIWRLGEPFEILARRFLPRAARYSPWQARLLHRLSITKSVRSEYDHLMLQLHDSMKSDTHYQQDGPQVSIAFASGSTWVCFSDQTAHAASSGQYLLEQTLHLPAHRQGNPGASPLAVLTRLRGHALI